MEWKKVKGFENYEISSAGYIRNSKGKILSTNRSTYQNKTLYCNGEMRSYNIHRLVAEAFIPNLENKEQVNHIDGNKHNNAVENLEWVTRVENSQHSYQNNLNKNFGSTHKNSIFVESEILEIRRLREEESLGYREIANKLNINKVTVGKICRRENWTHI